MVETPPKTSTRKSEYSGLITESKRWDSFVPRRGDVVVSTPPKSGTTWVQAILALLFTGDPGVDANPSVNAPWFDNRLHDLEEVVSRLEAMTGRRQVKTHTPLDGVPIWDDVFYISVYRHPIDVHFSSRKHVANYQPEIAEFLGVNETTFPSDPRDSFRVFLEGDDIDHGSLKTVVHHYLRCLDLEPGGNLLRLHYADMKRDLPSCVAQITSHLGVRHSTEVMEKLIKAATFDNMKANAHRFGLAAGKGFWKTDAGFFDSATSNKWQGILTDQDLADYDIAISQHLNPEQRKWLEFGDL